MDHIIKCVPADNNWSYKESEDRSNTFKIKEDPQQKDKERLFELKLNTEENTQNKKNRVERAEWKRI